MLCKALANAPASGSGSPSIWRRPNVATPRINDTSAATALALIQSTLISVGEWAKSALSGIDTTCSLWFETSAADLKFLQHLQQTLLGTSNRKAALEL